MKRIPLPVVAESAEQMWWRTLAERADAARRGELAATEFAPHAATPPVGMARRSFLQIMGSAISLAGLGACSKPPSRRVVPYTKQPAELTPGNALHYATAFERDGFATGVLVTAREGRPVKIEGNPDHPASLGAAGSFEQAEILGLYDPDREVPLTRSSSAHAWPEFLAESDRLATEHASDGGARLAFLLEPTASPLRLQMRARIRGRFPKARVIVWSGIADGTLAGSALAFGVPLEPRFDLRAAKTIVALDADFLAQGPEWLRLAREFADGRSPGDAMSRLYVAEPCLTVTGMSADHRLRVTGTEVGGIALQLAAALAAARPVLQPLAVLASSFAPAEAAQARWTAAVAKELLANAGRAALIVGSRQPAVVHAIAAAIDSALANSARRWNTPLRDIAQPRVDLAGIDTLVVAARNPLQGAPASARLGEAFATVRQVLYLAPLFDETARASTWVIPAAHALESWSDARAADGTISIVQPLIDPLFHGRTETEILAAFLGQGGAHPQDLLRDFWRAKMPDAFETHWTAALAKGVVPHPTPAPLAPPALRVAAIAAAAHTLAPPHVEAADDFEIGFALDGKVHDGRFANNAWLQELPDPVTKLTWGNAALVSPFSARALAIASGDILKIARGAASIEVPAIVLPGHADGAVTLALGYGQRGALRIANGIGADANVIRRVEALSFDRVRITRTGRRAVLAITQDHATMEGRSIALDETLDEVKAGSKSAEEHRRREPSLYQPAVYSGNQWAMSIDLNRCTGCSACVVACQSENNIPTVGPEDVAKGREMHWLRIDRWFKGSESDPESITEPLACVHCEDAPCEYVCPVEATVHSDEGLNEQIYNRCIGTRYCSNNCPYKVRRFNWFDYSGTKPEIQTLAANPDVTVRNRGVMEKCTYCVQRIEHVRIGAHLEGREIRDGEWVTACAQACPTRAIVVGSLHDPATAVSKMHADPRRWDLLGELNTKPRTAYLTRVRNKNPELT